MRGMARTPKHTGSVPCWREMCIRDRYFALLELHPAVSGEVKLILDEDGHCIDVKKRPSGESEAMIEEFLLLANQCDAHFARVKQIPLSLIHI